MANEKRLIDKDALIEDLEAAKANNGMGGMVASALIRYVKRCPTVDAVEVVRCKDCKHLEITGCYGECGRAYLSGIVKPWDFCPYGELKTENP